MSKVKIYSCTCEMHNSLRRVLRRVLRSGVMSLVFVAAMVPSLGGAYAAESPAGGCLAQRSASQDEQRGFGLVPLEADTAVLQGTLPNGLTYIIRHNELPKKTAEFYIAQKVGAVLEEDNQDGLAHFLEHMAFNGTKNFPGKGVIDFLERVGVRFGENINAYTSVDETVYNLSAVPTEDPAIVDSALLVLHDWSGFISLEAEEIDKERGVIREEWRTRNSASRRFFFGHRANTMSGTRYAVRDVIGDTVVINNFKYDELRAYYHKWYRPDLQGIVVVGDVDPKKIEAKIKELWADIPAQENPAKREYFSVPISETPVVSILKDPEATSTSLTVEFRYEAEPDSVRNSVQGYVSQMVSALAYRIFNNRMVELIHGGAPLSRAFMVDTDITPTMNSIYCSCVAKSGQTAEGFGIFLDEIERFRRYGANKGELMRVRDNLLSAYENAYEDRMKTPSEDYVSQYYNSFLSGDVITSIEYEYDLAKAILPAISVEMVNARIAEYFEPSPVFEISALQDDDQIRTAEEYIADYRSLGTKEMEPYEDKAVDKNLVDDEPEGGKVVKRKTDKVYGAEVVTLSNGVKVYLKPTTYADNEIRLTAYSHGGYSTYPASYVISASQAGSVIAQMGLGKYSYTDLRRALTGRTASVGTGVSLYTEHISGNSNKKDLETMLQMVYLSFGEPRRDDEAYAAMKSRLESQLANLMRNPNMIYSDSLSTIIRDGNPYLQSIYTPEDLEGLSIDKVIEVYKGRFGSAKGFDFVIVGSFDTDSILPLVAKWIGGLPVGERSTKVEDRDVYSVQRDIECSFRLPMETDKTRSTLYMSHKHKRDRKEQLSLYVLGEVLNMRYLESVREDEGGSYGVHVSTDLCRKPNSEYTLYIAFDTDPAAYDRLFPILTKEIQTIADNGPRADDFDKVTKHMVKAREEALQDNGTWLSLIKNRAMYGDDDSEYAEIVGSIKPKDVQEWAKRILKEAHRVVVTMMPEK